MPSLHVTRSHRDRMNARHEQLRDARLDMKPDPVGPESVLALAVGEAGA